MKYKSILLALLSFAVVSATYGAAACCPAPTVAKPAEKPKAYAKHTLAQKAKQDCGDAVCKDKAACKESKDCSDCSTCELSLVGTDVVGTAAESGQFKTLSAALQAAGLTDALRSAESVTLFAPTDEAFAALPAGVLEMLLEPQNKATLVSILQYHVLPSKVMSSEVTSGQTVTLSGEPVAVAVYGGKVKVGGAQVKKADIPATNGIIHAIDSVMLPPSLGL